MQGVGSIVNIRVKVEHYNFLRRKVEVNIKLRVLVFFLKNLSIL